MFMCYTTDLTDEENVKNVKKNQTAETCREDCNRSYKKSDVFTVKQAKMCMEKQCLVKNILNSISLKLTRVTKCFWVFFQL